MARVLNQRSVTENFIMNCILKLSSFLVPLIIFPYVSRVLLPDGIGKVSFATSVVNYFLIFVQLGIPTYGIRSVAQVRDDRDALSKRVIEILSINIVMILITGTAFLLFVTFILNDNGTRLLYCILGITLVLDPLGVEWFYSGLERYRYIMVRSILFKTTALLGILLFVKDQQDYLVYAFFTVFASAGSYLCNFIALHQYIDIKKIKLVDALHHLIPISLFCAMSIATTVYTNLDNIMLGIITDDTEVGYYSTVVKVRSVLLSIVTALGAVLLPRSSYYVENGLYEKFRNISKKAFYFIWIIALPITIFFILIAEDCMRVFGGNEFAPAAGALKWIMPTVLLVGVSNLTGIQMLVPLKKEKVVLKSVIYGAVVDFLLNLFLIPHFMSKGAAIATTITEVVVVIVQLHAFERDNVKELFNIKWSNLLLGNIIAVIVCGSVMLFTDNIYVRLVCAIPAYFFSYFIFLLLTKDYIIMEMVCRGLDLIRRLKKR